ncbi:vacuolar import and degradation protein-domain-containing protein [Aspergillus cavernicola]|uniref:Vacuolar import and degradation protein-domain-containing protein n=1 Tax=Aspergillus cavernicola TaxID=176166 RepID=A0ABR4IGY6_9EURO
MPPVNSRSDTPSRSPLAASSSLQSLPAAVSDDAHDDNVNFLRSRVRSPPDPSSSLLSRQRRRRQHILSEFDIDPMDLDDSNMRTSVEINHRIPILRRQRDAPNDETHSIINNSNPPNYENRVSIPRNTLDGWTPASALYGWAPVSDDDDDDIPPYNPPIHSNALSSWLGRIHERSSSTSRRPARRETVPWNHTVMPDGTTENSHRPNGTPDASQQSIPRQPRFSRPRALQDYLLGRERASEHPDESRDRSGAASASRAYRFLPGSRLETHRGLTHNDLRARVSAHRQMHLETPPSPRLKETIRYLDRLRYSNSFEESLTSAAAGGFVQLDLLAWDEDDFILDTSSISPPPECSWLRPGMTFTGSQRAASSPGVILSHQGSSSTPNDPMLPMIVNGSEQNRISVQTTNGTRYLASQICNMGSGKDENWPVKVTIHNINTQDMTLTGTMEAYNIPDKTSPSQDAHIVTFLEGEIIDFNTHTLETKNFKADAEIDSTYWRELQPFKNLTDEEMTRNLVSRRWITDELCKGWILMRWKERCFITPTDARQGLTISGFYYISLHREGGQIEGLYYDPGSSPYQQLSLNPETEKMIQPSYRFR